MKQVLEIEVPEGKRAIWKDGKIVFEDIAPKLPETWEEFCSLHSIEGEFYITNISSIDGITRSRRSSSSDKHFLPSKEAAKAHLALMQLHQLRDCYRQGWIPDWEDGVSDKYCIEFALNRYAVFIQNRCSRFLSFQSQELAEKFLKNFIVLIKQAGDLI